MSSYSLMPLPEKDTNGTIPMTEDRVVIQGFCCSGLPPLFVPSLTDLTLIFTSETNDAAVSLQGHI